MAAEGAGAVAQPEAAAVEGGKAHASWFGEADAELANRAAGPMGYSVLRVTSPDIASKALEVAEGRIFATSGKGFVPFCRTAAYEALCGFEGASRRPRRVPMKGWFEAIVADARGDSLYVLR